MKIAKVISGGQTGADQAALDTAIALGIPQILENRPGSVDRQRSAFQVKSAQIAHTEMAQQSLPCIAAFEVPVREGRQMRAFRQARRGVGISSRAAVALAGAAS